MGWPIETPKEKRRWTRRHVLGITLVVVAILNFITVATLGPGDPFAGKVEGDRYYVSHPGRYYLATNTYREKSYTEVSREAWHLAKVHLISQLFSIPLGIYGAFMFNRADLEAP